MGTRVRIEIPNSPGTGPIFDEDDVARLPGERPPLLSNRHYVLDQATYGHLPMVDDRPIYVTIVEARLDSRTVVLTVDIGHDDIGALIQAHGDPAPGYAAVMYGENGLRVAEIGLAPPLALPEPEPEPERQDTLAAWLRWRFGGMRAFGVPFGDLGDADQSYWEHEAEAVRRAVARGGFKREEASGAAAPRP